MQRKMIKSFLIAAITVLLLTTNVNAAGIGIRGGLNFSSLPSKTELTLPDDNRIIEALPESYTGFHVGVVGYFSLLSIFIQPELLYTRTGQDMMISKPDDESNPDFFTNNYNYLSMPVVIGTTFGPLRIGLGPAASLFFDSKQEWDDIEFDQNRFTIGYQVMAGLKFGNIMLDLKYEGNLSKLGDGVTVAGAPFDFDTRPRQFILSVGILLN